MINLNKYINNPDLLTSLEWKIYYQIKGVQIIPVAITDIIVNKSNPKDYVITIKFQNITDKEKSNITIDDFTSLNPPILYESYKEATINVVDKLCTLKNSPEFELMDRYRNEYYEELNKFFSAIYPERFI